MTFLYMQIPFMLVSNLYASNGRCGLGVFPLRVCDEGFKVVVVFLNDVTMRGYAQNLGKRRQKGQPWRPVDEETFALQIVYFIM